MRVLRLEVYVYNVYITNQFQTTFAWVGAGGVIPFVEVTVNIKEKTLKKGFCPNDVQEFGLCLVYRYGTGI